MKPVVSSMVSGRSRVVQVMTPTPLIRGGEVEPLIDPTDRTGAPHHAARDDLSAGHGEGMTEQPTACSDRTHRR